ncbi:hypothetical protein TcWFU_003060 [Taenia crassiceps]|uniref:Uncharacterized protein n=1 Tax=Taenia crassiceps TaxID=6207 RepID=A0ABR4QGJ0_9CEST
MTPQLLLSKHITFLSLTHQPLLPISQTHTFFLTSHPYSTASNALIPSAIAVWPPVPRSQSMLPHSTSFLPPSNIRTHVVCNPHTGCTRIPTLHHLLSSPLPSFPLLSLLATTANQVAIIAHFKRHHHILTPQSQPIPIHHSLHLSPHHHPTLTNTPTTITPPIFIVIPMSTVAVVVAVAVTVVVAVAMAVVMRRRMTTIIDKHKIHSHELSLVKIFHLLTTPAVTPSCSLATDA